MNGLFILYECREVHAHLGVYIPIGCCQHPYKSFFFVLLTTTNFFMCVCSLSGFRPVIASLLEKSLLDAGTMNQK